MFHDIDLFLSNSHSPNGLGFTNVGKSIKSYSVSYDMYSSCGTLTASLDPAHLTSYLYLNYQPVQFTFVIDGVKMMKGFIDKQVLNRTKEATDISIHGRDMCQVLIDNHLTEIIPHTNITLDALIKKVWAGAKSKSYLTKSIKNGGTSKNQLTKTVTVPAIDFPYYSPDLKAKNLQNFLFNIVNMQMGQSMFDFLREKCNELGIFFYNVPGTDKIMFHTAPTPKQGKHLSSYDYESNPIKEVYTYSPETVKSYTATQDITSYYKFIRLTGTSETAATDDSNEGIIDTSGKTDNPYKASRNAFHADIISPLGTDEVGPNSNVFPYNGVSKIGVVTLNNVNKAMWDDPKNQEVLINSHLLSQTRELYSVKATVIGHGQDTTQSDGTVSFGSPYFFNKVMRDINGFSESLVYGVEFNGSKEGGQTTTLEMSYCVPVSFDELSNNFNKYIKGLEYPIESIPPSLTF